MSKQTKGMATSIRIEKVYYFSGKEFEDSNANVLYVRDRKTHLARVYIDFFNKRIHVPRQEKDAKVYSGFDQAINRYANKTNWNFQ